MNAVNNVIPISKNCHIYCFETKLKEIDNVYRYKKYSSLSDIKAIEDISIFEYPLPHAVHIESSAFDDVPWITYYVVASSLSEAAIKCEQILAV